MMKCWKMSYLTLSVAVFCSCLFFAVVPDLSVGSKNVAFLTDSHINLALGLGLVTVEKKEEKVNGVNLNDNFIKVASVVATIFATASLLLTGYLVASGFVTLAISAGLYTSLFTYLSTLMWKIVITANNLHKGDRATITAAKKSISSQLNAEDLEGIYQHRNAEVNTIGSALSNYKGQSIQSGAPVSDDSVAPVSDDSVAPVSDDSEEVSPGALLFPVFPRSTSQLISTEHQLISPEHQLISSEHQQETLLL